MCTLCFLPWGFHVAFVFQTPFLTRVLSMITESRETFANLHSLPWNPVSTFCAAHSLIRECLNHGKAWKSLCQETEGVTTCSEPIRGCAPICHHHDILWASALNIFHMRAVRDCYLSLSSPEPLLTCPHITCFFNFFYCHINFYFLKNHTKYTILAYLIVQFSSTKCIHIVLKLSPSSIIRIFHLPKLKFCSH